MKTIGLVNQKGGVSKTTCALSLGVSLSNKGYSVLLIDMDPQANLTSSLLKDVEVKHTVGEFILGQCTFENTVLSVNNKLDLLPSNILMITLDTVLLNELSKETKLLKALGRAVTHKNYDYIIIDSSPSLGSGTINVLCACDEIIIPVNPEAFSLDGLTQILDTVDAVKDADINPDLKVNGVVFTRVDIRRKGLTSEIKDKIACLAYSKNIPIYQTVIRNLTAIANISVATVDKIPDISEFVLEFLEKEKKGATSNE